MKNSGVEEMICQFFARQVYWRYIYCDLENIPYKMHTSYQGWKQGTSYKLHYAFLVNVYAWSYA